MRFCALTKPKLKVIARKQSTQFRYLVKELILLTSSTRVTSKMILSESNQVFKGKIWDLHMMFRKLGKIASLFGPRTIL